MIELPQTEANEGFFAKFSERFKSVFDFKKMIGNKIQSRLQDKILEAEANYQQEVYLKFQHDAQGEVVTVCHSLQSHNVLNTFTFKELLYSAETMKDAQKELNRFGINPATVFPAVEEKAKQLIPKGHYFAAFKSEKTAKARIFLYQNGVKAPVKSNIKLSELM